MRIGLVTGEYPPMQGGVGAFTRELGCALTRQGQYVSILTDRQVGDRQDGDIQVCGQVKDWNRASVFQIRRWADVQRLDLVNIQYETAAFQMAALVHWLPSRLKPLPTVTTFHDLLVPYLFPKAGDLRYQALLTLGRRSDGVIVTNREDEARLSEEYDIAPLCQIPIGSNISPAPPLDYDRAAWRQKLGVPADGVLVGYFGFLNATKGIDTLINAAQSAIRSGINLYLLMIGGRTGSSDPTNEAYADKIDGLIQKAGLTTRLHWTGFVDDAQVSGHLLACDLLALPYKDGASLRRGSFMAGIAHGCVIITTTPTLDLPELRDGVNVCLVPPDSPDTLATVIQNLAQDSTLCQTLRTNARLLSERFTWEHIAADTLAFYRRVIAETVA